MLWIWEKCLPKHITCRKPLLKMNVYVVQCVKNGLNGSKRPIVDLRRSSFRTPKNFDWRRLSRFSLIEMAITKFFLRGETSFQNFETLRHYVRKTRPEMWASEEWVFIHHDNAPVHSSFHIRDFCTTNAIAVVPQPPH